MEITIKLNQEEIALLKKCLEKGYLEYRDSEFSTVEEFQKSEIFQPQSWYLIRNENGTLSLAEELAKVGFLQTDDLAWHLTYIITEKGKKVLEDEEV